ncbi:hypothetical protein [Streptomyces europaeiscabiei]|nr:hypothetical protein [Streptomyces europaeiscabiei]MDX3588507.1 hypothetical protein [Streptomyces europaeiscabiei]
MLEPPDLATFSTATCLPRTQVSHLTREVAPAGAAPTRVRTWLL